MLAEEDGNVQAVGERGRKSTTRQSWDLERRFRFCQESLSYIGVYEIGKSSVPGLWH